MRTCRTCGKKEGPDRVFVKGQNLCRPCRSAKSKAYHKANAEKIASRKKAWYEANREKEVARKKAYYEANREKEAARHKAYRKANPEKMAARDKACGKAYYEANPEKVAARHKAYRKANPEKAAARERALISNLAPGYVRACVRKRSRLSTPQVTDYLVELARLNILIKRELKELRDGRCQRAKGRCGRAPAVPGQTTGWRSALG